ncbi:hypothetical protein [Candidatus Phycosocius spiralis]|uniref:Uncharacterized protein n=1 Tax=Candidatus Phycosocius spiralis TaxID=2815099 RepID=A0ABQ4PWR8_9PROT|nr:hypothetical protein [Candidatus Phycosocius spiralis]GIU67468.1 hypothetical protein PsB1_1622 [Candidatus Phycosocius spiralis]
MRALTMEELEFVSGGMDVDRITVTARRTLNGGGNMWRNLPFNDYQEPALTETWVPLNQNGQRIERIDFQKAAIAVWEAMQGRDLDGDGSSREEFEWACALTAAVGYNVSIIIPQIKAGMTVAQFARLFVATEAARMSTIGVVGLIGVGASRGYYW